MMSSRKRALARNKGGKKKSPSWITVCNQKMEEIGMAMNRAARRSGGRYRPVQLMPLIKDGVINGKAIYHRATAKR